MDKPIKSNHIYRVVVIDDDYIIREVVKKVVKNKLDGKCEIYTSNNGLEGLGLVYVVKPDLIILDTTLPRYAGVELMKFLESNLKLSSRNIPIILLHENNAVPITEYNNLFVINKTEAHFIERLQNQINTIFRQSSSKFSNTVFNKLRNFFGKNAIAYSNASDILLHTYHAGNLLLAPFWIGLQLLGSGNLVFFYIFSGGRTYDNNFQQDTSDKFKYRVKVYPTIATIFISIFISLLQVGIFVAGGVTVLNSRIGTILAQQNCPLPSAPAIINTQYTITADSTDGVVDCSTLDLIIGPTGELVINSNKNIDGNSANDWGVTLLVNNLTVQAGGKINANGKGYSVLENDTLNGTGGSSVGQTGGAGGGYGGGGGQGVEDGTHASGFGGQPYGNQETPNLLGSAGGDGAVASNFQKTWTSSSDFDGGSYSSGLVNPSDNNEIKLKNTSSTTINQTGLQGIVTSGLAGDWNLNESSGSSAADSSGNSGPDVNIALGKSVAASSAYGYFGCPGPSYATDGNTGTCFAPDGYYGNFYRGGEWLQVDLGSVQNFYKVEWTDSVGGSSIPIDYNISISTDGTNFTNVVNVTGNTDTTRTHDLGGVQSARYVRMTVTNVVYPSFAVSEFRVFQSGGQAGSATGTTIVDGIKGKARSFNGTSDYVEIPDSNTLDLNQFSIGAWVKINQLPSTQAAVISKNPNDNGNTNYNLWVMPDGKVDFNAGNGNAGATFDAFHLTSNTVLTTGNWYHIVGTADGSTAKIFINGNLDISGSISGTPHSNSNSVTIGARKWLDAGGGTDSYFNGVIDEVMIYNRGLTDSEIMQNYNDVHLGTVGYWKLDEASGTNLADSSFFQNSATATGTSVVSGISSNARSFNGSSDYIDVGNPLGTSTVNSYTVSLWAKSGALGQVTYLAGNMGGLNARGWQLGINSNNKIQPDFFDTPSGTEYNWDSNFAFTDTTTWHHIVFVYEGGNTIGKLYVDGTLDSQLTSISSSIGLNNGLTTKIGNRGNVDASGYFNGSIDEVRFYNRALTTGEVTGLYSITSGYATGEQTWTSDTIDAGSGNSYKLNKFTVNYTLDGTDNIQPKFQLLGSTSGSFSGEETIFPNGSGSYYQNGGTYSITSGAEKDTTSEVTSSFRYWKVKAVVDTGSNTSDTPKISDITVKAIDLSTSTAVGGNGGGSIKILSTGTVTIDGGISANGDDGAGNGTTSGGGGSGGSIWIEANSLAGSGSISAAGGGSATATFRGGGGGGGRVLAFCTTDNAFTGTVSVSGGTVTNAQNGGVGTKLGPTCRPQTPTILKQFKSSGSAEIPVGGIATGQTVIFAGDMIDPDNSDTLSLQIEIKPLGTNFTGVPNFTQTSFVPNPKPCLSPTVDCGTITATLNSSTQYHWQARVRDNHGGFSQWASFGGNQESDRDVLVSGVARNIVYSSGNNQSGTVFTNLAQPLVAEITDASGFPVPGYDVLWSIPNAQNGGSLTSSVVVTDDNGLASNTYKVGKIAGNNVVTAYSGGLTGSPVTFTETGVVDQIHHFIMTGPQYGIINQSFGPVNITAYDQYNNIKTDYTGTVNLTPVEALNTQNQLSGTLTPSNYTFVSGDNGVKALNFTYDTAQSIKIKATDGTATGFTNSIAVVTSLNSCPDVDGIIDSDQTWTADANNHGIFDCRGLTINVTNNANLNLISYDNGDGDWTNDYGVTVLADAINIDAGSTINGNSGGYVSYRGPGHSGDGGASYGGFGMSGASPYGSPYEPADLGSGGGNCFGVNTSGGGAVKLITSGDITNNGSIDVNSGNAGTFCGSGSGGSVWMDIGGNLAGDGTVQSNAGAAGWDNGGGSGGRIAIYYNTDSSTMLSSLGTGTPKITAFGACHSHGCFDDGGPGTIYVEHKGVDVSHRGNLYIDGNNISGHHAALPEGDYVFNLVDLTRYGHLDILGNNSSLTITNSNSITGDSTKPTLDVYGTFIATPTTLNINGVTLGVRGEISIGGNNANADIVVGDSMNGGLNLFANTWAHNSANQYTFKNITAGGNGSINLYSYDNGDGDWTNDYGVTLNIVQNITVQNNGTLNTDSGGYSAGRGAGQAGGNGASYGGWGMGGSNPYGSPYQPTDLGSGGGSCFGVPGNGGGAAKLIVSGDLINNGRISSNSNNTGTYCGSGSGGSIWLDIEGNLSGDGSIQSNAGAAGWDNSGGSGGRIAIYYNTDSSSMLSSLGTGTPKITAFGACHSHGCFDAGGAGTIYVEHKGEDVFHEGSLYIDNNNVSGHHAALPMGSYVFKLLKLTRYGHLDVLGNSSSLTLRTNNALTGDSTKPTLDVYGTFIAEPTQLNLDDVTLGVRGEIIVGGDNANADITVGATAPAAINFFANTWAHNNTNQYTFKDITADTHGVINLYSYDNGDGDWTNDYGVTLNLVDNLTIANGGNLNANNGGYGVYRGPGQAGGGGASYGGYGIGGVAPYGNVYTPVDLGSGGGSCFGVNSNGGGAMHLVVNGTLTNNGAIQSNSSDAGTYCGSGSGGSILINSAGSLSGDGTINSNAGAAGWDQAGGSGGRISIYYNTDNSTMISSLGTGTPKITAFGACHSHGCFDIGGAGSIYVEQTGVDTVHQGSLYIDSNNVSGHHSGLPEGNYQFKLIKQTRYGHLDIIGQNSNLTINTSDTIQGDTTRPTLDVYGTFIDTQNSININGFTLGVRGEWNLGGDNTTADVTVGNTLTGGLSLYANTWAHNSANQYTLHDLNVAANGSVILNGYDNGDGVWTNDYGVGIHLTHNLNISSGGSLNADAAGYTAGRGAGQAGGGGASYGGYGFGGAQPYGSPYQPVDLGSGGGSCFGVPGNGGGAIKLVVDGDLTNDGTISSNSNNAGTFCGPGSGGSIWLDINGNLAGAGTVTANSGAAGWDNAGGSGGRIAVYYNNDSSSILSSLGDGSPKITAFGACHSHGCFDIGGAGTIYVEHKNFDVAQQGSLYIDNNNINGHHSAIPQGNYVFKLISLTRYGHLDILGNTSTLSISTSGALSGDSTRPVLDIYGTLLSTPTTININGLSLGIRGDINIGGDNSNANIIIGDTLGGGLNLFANTWAHINTPYVFKNITVGPYGIINLYSYDSGDGDWTNDYGVTVSTTQDFDIQAGGVVSADGNGYSVGRGPGTNGNSASYGGYGMAGFSPYGDIYTPLDLGSGGGSCFGVNSNGGGAMKLLVGGNLTDDGVITSNSFNAGTFCGSGSGGSIILDTQTLSGAGTVRANAGAAGWDNAGGSGGRIAVYYNVDSSSIVNTLGTVTPKVTAFGACHSHGCQFGAGGAGSIYVEDKNNDPTHQGSLYFDNAGIGGRAMDFAAIDYNLKNLYIGNNVYMVALGDTTALATGFNYPDKPVQAELTPDANTVALLHLNETSGTGAYLSDATGNGYNAIPNGTTSSVPGKFNNAEKTNTTGDRLTFDNNIPLATSWTIDFWSKFPLNTTPDGWRTFAYTGANHPIIVHAGGDIGVYNSGFYDTGYNINSLIGWHHIAAVAENNQTKFYVDGKYVGSVGTITYGSLTSLGNYNVSSANQFWGAFDEVDVSNKALSEDEVNAHFFGTTLAQYQAYKTAYAQASTHTVGRGVAFYLTGNFTMKDGAFIDGRYQGFPSDQGPGHGLNGAGQSGGAGGSYGGTGGIGQSDGGNPAPNAGAVYGSQREPLNLGSGGGSSGVGDLGGKGGGAVAVRARTGNIQIASTAKIDVSGEVGHTGSPGGGGGAGGSLLVEGSTCSIDGTLGANGGDGGASTFDGGGGGGGRVSILYTQGPCDVNGTVSYAPGSSVQAQPGQVGTYPTITTIPSTPSFKEQYKSDGATVIPVGGYTPEQTVTLKVNISDPGATVGTPKDLQAEFEVVGSSSSFTGASVIKAPLKIDNYALDNSSVLASGVLGVSSSSSQTYSGGTPLVATVSVPGLNPGEGYKWRARVINVNDSINGTWTNFGNGITADFIVSNTSGLTITPSSTNVTAGQPLTLTVTALNNFNNPDSTYTGTVTFSSTAGGSASLPSNYSFNGSDNGSHIFTNQLTFNTAGTYTVTVQDTVAGTLTATTTNIVVTSSTQSMTISPSTTSVTVGQTLDLTVVGRNGSNNPDSLYRGMVTFTSSAGSNANLPSNYTYQASDSGTHLFNNISFNAVGTYTITVTDTSNGALTATTTNITVTPAATSFTITPSSTNVTVGDTITLDVAAKTPANSTDTTYRGTVHFTSTAGVNALLPSDYSFIVGDSGAHTFTNGLIFTQAGTYTVTIADTSFGSITGTTATITVVSSTVPFNTTAFDIVPNKFAASTNEPLDITVTAKNAGNTVDTTYLGTVHFTSTASTDVILPNNYQYQVSDSGVHIFTGELTFTKAGTYTVTVYDVVHNTVTNTTANIVVTDSTTSLSIKPDKTETFVGEVVDLTVKALDSTQTTDSLYRGTVTFSSTANENANLPADYSYVSADAGQKLFNSLKFSQPGTYKVTVTDKNNSALTATTEDINVVPVPAGEAVQIINVKTENVDSTTIKVCWETNIDTVGSVSYGKQSDATYSSSTPIEDTFATTHCAELSNLDENTAYIFKITSTSHTGTRDNFEGTTDKTIAVSQEVTQCIVSDPNGAYAFNNNHEAIISYHTMDDALCTFSYGTNNKSLDHSFSENIKSKGHIAVINLQDFDGTSDIYYKIDCGVTTASGNIDCQSYDLIPASKYKDYYLASKPVVQSTLITNVSTVTPSVIAAATVIANIVAYPRLFFSAIPWIIRRRKKGSWGIVYDDETRKPIPFVTVRLYNEDGVLLKQMVTSFDGKFGFIADAGKYKIIFKHADYEEFEFKADLKEKEGIVSENIGLHLNKEAGKKGKQVSFRKKLQENLFKLNQLIGGIGLIISIIAFVISPTIINLFIILFYFIQIVVVYIILKPAREWGYVYETSNYSRLKGASVRVFDTVEKRQIDVQLTDEKGRFGFSLKDGDYNIQISMPGYKLPGNITKQFDTVTTPTGQVLIKVKVSKKKQLSLSIPMEHSGKGKEGKFGE